MPGYKREFQAGSGAYGQQMPSINYPPQQPQQPAMPQYFGNPMYGGDQMTFGGQSPYGGQVQPQYMGGVAPNGYPGMMGNRGMQPRRRLQNFTPYMESMRPFDGIK